MPARIGTLAKNGLKKCSNLLCKNPAKNIDGLLPLTEFYSDKRTKDGLGGRCAYCYADSTEKWYGKNAEAVSLKRKARYKKKTKEENEACKKYYYAHPEIGRSSNWKRSGIKNKDLTPFTYLNYEEAVKAQENKCAICGTEIASKKNKNGWHVDHHHKTGVFRGLLCSDCNVGIGRLKDDFIIAMKASEYLKRSR